MAIVPALVCVAALAWAADPFVGDWKLDVEKSSFGNGPAAQSGSATYSAEGEGYLYRSETDFGDERISRLEGPVQFDGSVNEGTLDGRAVTFVSKRIDANSFEVIVTDKRTGAVSNRFRHTVSEGGKTLTMAWSRAERVVWKLVYGKP